MNARPAWLFWGCRALAWERLFDVVLDGHAGPYRDEVDALCATPGDANAWALEDALFTLNDPLRYAPEDRRGRDAERAARKAARRAA